MNPARVDLLGLDISKHHGIYCQCGLSQGGSMGDAIQAKRSVLKSSSANEASSYT